MTDAPITLVDANVLIDVVSHDAAHGATSRRALAAASLRGPIAINQLIYAEIAAPFASRLALDRALETMEVTRVDLPWAAGFRAAEAFVAYRRSGGSRRSPLPDFYIGAHAETARVRLMTRDRGRYATYFPTVELVVPA